MADRCVTTGARFGQTRLPPIPGKRGTGQNLMLNENFLHYLPRLPRIERHPLVETKTLPAFPEREGNRKLSNPCLNRKEISGDSRRKTVAFLESADLAPNGKGQLSCITKNDHSLKEDVTKTVPVDENVLRRPVHLLRRRIKPEKVYRHRNGQMSHDELLLFDQNIDQLCSFTERGKNVEMSDLDGTKLDSNRTGNGDITSYMAVFDVENKTETSVQEKKSASSKKMSKTKVPSKKETETRVEARFFEALDLHFYHYYRNSHPGRRMAICEEIERTICVDNMALSSVRDNLRLQEVLDGWIL